MLNTAVLGWLDRCNTDPFLVHTPTIIDLFIHVYKYFKHIVQTLLIFLFHGPRYESHNSTSLYTYSVPWLGLKLIACPRLQPSNFGWKSLHINNSPLSTVLSVGQLDHGHGGTPIINEREVPLYLD